MGLSREELTKRREQLDQLIQLSESMESIQSWFAVAKGVARNFAALKYHSLNESSTIHSLHEAGQEIEAFRKELRALIDKGAQALSDPAARFAIPVPVEAADEAEPEAEDLENLRPKNIPESKDLTPSKIMTQKKSNPNTKAEQAVLNLLKDGQLYEIEEVVSETELTLQQAHRALEALVEQGDVAVDKVTKMYEIVENKRKAGSLFSKLNKMKK